MSIYTSPEQICNLAVSKFGDYPDVENIDTPETDIEKILSLIFPLTRQIALKTVQPNFAIKRVNLAVYADDPVFGYSYQYLLPADCLLVLGINNIEDKLDNLDYAVEGQFIKTDLSEDSTGTAGELPIRYVADIDDVSKWTAEFCVYVSNLLARDACMAITKDPAKQAYLDAVAQNAKMSCGALNSMENRPIKVNKCWFDEAKIGNFEKGRKK